jgi:hypothetical protein
MQIARSQAIGEQSRLFRLYGDRHASTMHLIINLPHGAAGPGVRQGTNELLGSNDATLAGASLKLK